MLFRLLLATTPNFTMLKIRLMELCWLAVAGAWQFIVTARKDSLRSGAERDRKEMKWPFGHFISSIDLYHCVRIFHIDQM